MSTSKASGRARQGTPRKGRRLGLKVSGGSKVKAGQILIRQIGSTYHPGDGVIMGRDFTLSAVKSGTLTFKKHLGKKTLAVL